LIHAEVDGDAVGEAGGSEEDGEDGEGEGDWVCAEESSRRVAGVGGCISWASVVE